MFYYECSLVYCCGDFPRVLRAAKKLRQSELEELNRALEDVDFTCGTVLQDYVQDAVNGSEPMILS